MHSELREHTGTAHCVPGPHWPELPTWKAVTADLASAFLENGAADLRGHRQLPSTSSLRRTFSCSDAPDSQTQCRGVCGCARQPCGTCEPHCLNQRKRTCQHSLCAWCCDKLWQHLGKVNPEVCCPAHQPDGVPQTWALFSKDEYLVQARDMGAWLDRLVNKRLAGSVGLVRGQGGDMVRMGAVIWLDGGKSGGRKMSKVMLLLHDDEQRVFHCGAVELTRATLAEIAVWKGGTDASTGPDSVGVEVIVGPLLEAVRDLKYGVVHRESGVRVVVDTAIIVADMHAEIQLASKENGSACHCPMCDAACRAVKEGDFADPWGEMQASLAEQRDKQCACYGDLLRRWKEEVAPRRTDATNAQKTLEEGYRKTTYGIGEHRPALARVQFQTSPTSKSEWAREFQQAELADPEEAAKFPEVDMEAEPEAVHYDTFVGTEEECNQARQCIVRWQMVMDEFHAKGNLIEALRDAIEQRVRWAGDRGKGVQAWMVVWAEWAHKEFYKLNWRGYHKALALSVMVHLNNGGHAGNYTKVRPKDLVPATLLDLAWLMTRLFDFWKTDPTKAPPPAVVLNKLDEKWARAHARISGCLMAWCTWFLGTTLLPETMGRSTALHCMKDHFVRVMAHRTYFGNIRCASLCRCACRTMCSAMSACMGGRLSERAW